MTLKQSRDARLDPGAGMADGTPTDWLDCVREGETHEQLQAVRRSVTKGQPYGSEPWVERMVTQWNLGATLRERGRPKKELVNNGS